MSDCFKVSVEMKNWKIRDSKKVVAYSNKLSTILDATDLKVAAMSAIMAMNGYECNITIEVRGKTAQEAIIEVNRKLITAFAEEMTAGLVIEMRHALSPLKNGRE
ncbi:hypothetical protein ACFL2D_00690 [Patescibacteria group bacterium]